MQKIRQPVRGRTVTGKTAPLKNTWDRVTDLLGQDIDGADRPQGCGLDKGADEYLPTGPIPCK